MPAPMPQKSGIIQSTRHQPGAVKRLRPVGGGAGACSTCAPCPLVATSVTSPPSTSRRELHKRVQLGLRQRLERRRHHVGREAFLDISLWIHNRLTDELLERHARLLCVIGELIEVGTDLPRALRGLQRVTRAAALADEHSLARRGTTTAHGLPGMVHPRGELVLRHHDHSRAHHRVAEAAELGADDRVGADPVRCDRDVRLDPRDGVLLLAELGDPERMDHVQGLQREARRAVDRQAEDVRGELVVLWIRERPGELLGGDVDLQRVRRRCGRSGRGRSPK